MKIKQLSTAIAAAIALSSSAYADDLTVYGKVNISLNKVDYDSSNEDKWDLTSNASRVGVKGSVEISENLKAIYKAEYQLKAFMQRKRTP